MSKTSAATSENAVKIPKSTFWILFFIVFIDLVGFGIVFPILPEVARTYQLSGFQTGLIIGIYSLMQFVFSPLLGKWSDKIGRRPVLLLSMAGTAVSFLLMGLAGKVGSFFEVFIIARALDGIAGSSMSTAQAYMADISPKAERTRNMGMWLGAAFGLGFALGPVVGALFQWIGDIAFPSYGPGFAFLIAAVLCATNWLFAYFKLPESLKHQESGHAVGKRTSSFWVIIETLMKPQIGQLMLGYGLTIFAFAFMESTITWLALDVYHIPKIGIYLLFAYFGLVICYGQGKLVRKLATSWGDRKLALVGALMLAVGLASMPLNLLGTSGWGLYAYLLLTSGIMCLGESLTQPSLISAISKLADDTVQGETMGVGQSLASLARFLGPLLAATLYTNSAVLPYMISAALMLVAMGLVQWGFSRQGKAEAVTAAS